MLFVQYSTPGSQSTTFNKISMKTIDWLKLKVNIANIIGSNLTLNDKLNSIQEQLFIAASTKPANNSIDKRKKRNSFWWTRELQIKRSKTRALRRLFQKETDPNLRQIKKVNYKLCQASYKKLILTTKRTKFKEFISTITNNTLFGNNFNIISNKKTRNSIRKPIVNSQGTPSTTIEESNATLIDYHFPWSNRNSTNPNNISQDDFIYFTQ
ncbi:hypothetical protein CDAR_391041 [Caerostris darwini]|uniref:Uncharacterized protein n=1 Tax=Caerostris darwini TaxID=1538125 RepID=A0AAV4UAH3_9ARAC|nr:hypothetical protein CDAR_391041 [Caerostris darwini]